MSIIDKPFVTYRLLGPLWGFSRGTEKSGYDLHHYPSQVVSIGLNNIGVVY